jgi:hypothetical protein
MADLVLGRVSAPDPRFSFASKGNVQRRAVL